MSSVKQSPLYVPVSPLKQAAKMLLLGLSFGLCHHHVLAAEQDWWFDVEVIIFKHDSNLSALSEKFAHQAISAEPTNALDLLTPYLRPDLSYLRAGLPFCLASSRAEKQKQIDTGFIFPAPKDTEIKAGQASANDSTSLAGTQATNVVNPPQQVALNKTLPVADNRASNESEYVAQDLSINWLEWQIPKQLPCVFKEQLTLLANPFKAPPENPNSLQNIAKVPVKINGRSLQHKGQAFLLPQSELNLSNLYNSINRQRDLQPLLYAGWRQEVKFGRNKAKALRLFAGQNYGQTFTIEGRLKADNALREQDSPYQPTDELSSLSEQELADHNTGAAMMANQALFADIYAQLEQSDEPLDLETFFVTAKTESSNDKPLNYVYQRDNEIWQLDGELKVYLQNVGRTPYLHIDSRFDYRQPVFDAALQHKANTQNTILLGEQNTQANKLESINVKHFKRVISKQLHYFDHPLFGMVVYITRYQWPDDPHQPENSN